MKRREENQKKKITNSLDKDNRKMKGNTKR